MAIIKKYIKPCITIVSINRANILSSSDTYKYLCSEFCKLWHICQDRLKGKYCLDIKYN